MDCSFFLVTECWIAFWTAASSCTTLHLGPVPQKLTVPPHIKKNPLSFPALWNLFSFSPTSCLSSSFLWASNSIRSSLVSSLGCTARSLMSLWRPSCCRFSSSFSLRITKLLMTTFQSLKVHNPKVHMKGLLYIKHPNHSTSEKTKPRD